MGLWGEKRPGLVVFAKNKYAGTSVMAGAISEAISVHWKETVEDPLLYRRKMQTG